MAHRSALLVLLSGALAATGVLAAPTAYAEPTPPACTAAWDGGAGTDEWRDAGNWVGDHLPGESDYACVSAPSAPDTLRLSGSDVVVAGLRTDTAVQVALDASAGLALGRSSTAASLTLVSGTVVIGEELRVEDVVQTGGLLSGTGDLVATSSLRWDGGDQAGSGETVVGADDDAVGVRLGTGATRTLQARELTTGRLLVDDGADVALADGGLLTVTDATTVRAAGGAVTGGGTVRLEGTLDLEQDAHLALGNTVELSAATTLGTDSLLTLRGLVTASESALVGGAGDVRVEGADTRAEFGGGLLPRRLSVDQADVRLTQPLFADRLTLRGGQLLAGDQLVSVDDAELEDATLASGRLKASGGLSVVGAVRLEHLTATVGTLTAPDGSAAVLTLADGSGVQATEVSLVGDADVLGDGTLRTESLGTGRSSTIGVPLDVTSALLVSPDSNLVLTGATTLTGPGLVGGSLTFDGEADVSTRIEATAPGAVSVGPRGVVHLDHGRLGGEGTALRIDGTVEGHGELDGDVVNAGTLRLDGLPLDVMGSLRQTPTGRLVLTQPLAGGVLGSSGEVALGGTLEVSVDGDLPPQGVHLVNGNPLTGELAGVVGVDGCARLDHDADFLTLVPVECFRVRRATGFEGDAARVRVQLEAAAPADTALTWRLTAGTAGAEDWDGPASGTVTVPRGERTAYVVVPLREDDATEPDETFEVEVVGDDLAGASARVTVRDDHLGTDYRYVAVPRLGRGLRPLDLGTSSVVGIDVPTVGEPGYWTFDPRTGDRRDPAPYQPRGLNGLDAGVGVCVDRGCVVEGATQTVLARPAGTQANPVELTDTGLVAGWLSDAELHTTPVTWASAKAQPVPVPLPAGLLDAVVADVSERGQVVGTGRFSGVEVAWTSGPDGTDVVPVPSSYGADVVVAGVDDDGVVAGHSVDAAGRPHGWRWTPGSDEVQDLGTGRFVLDVGSDGQLVGGSVAADGATTAQLWRGRWIDLNDVLDELLGQQYDGSLHLWRTQLVNDQGTLVVEGTAAGQTRTAVLLPPDAGCRVCLDSALEEAVWPDPEEFAPAGPTVTEGNPVRVATTITNRTARERALTLEVTGFEGETVARHGVDLAPGETADLEHLLDVDGLAWDHGTEHAAVDVTVRLTDEQGAVLGRATMRTAVAPRPVVMVHGMNSDAATWAAYPAMLEAAHSRWRGFAVDTLHTGVTDSVPLPQNAAALAAYVARVQREQDVFQVDLVAHSMGGLISRYYLHTEPLDPDVPRPVRRLVMLGTPNAGSRCADLVPVAMTAPLRTDWMRKFNERITDRKGVPFSVGYGNVMDSTCGESGGSDSVVSVASARTGVTDAVPFPLWHTDLTASQQLFTDFVLPRLDGQSPAGPAARAQATAAPDEATQPQVLSRESATLAAHGSWSTQVPVPADAASFRATALGQGLTVALERDGVTASSGDARETFPTAVAVDPAAGPWTLTVTNGTGAQRTVPVTTWLTGTPAELAVTATPAGLGQVRVTAAVRGDDQPLLQVLATFDGGTELELSDAGDGTWTGTASGLPAGEAVVDVRASRPGFQRIVSAAVDVPGAQDGPGDDAPVAWDGEVTVPARTRSLLPMDAADPEGGALRFDIVEPPAHGTLGGTTAPFTYLSTGDYEGPDQVRWRVGDGHGWSAVATTRITVGRVPTEIQLAQPRDWRLVGGADRTVSVGVRRLDNRWLADRGTVTYRLGDQERTKVLGTPGNGVTFPVPSINGDLPLEVSYSGTDTLAPATFSTQLHVSTGSAPVPTLLPLVGEAGYPLRAFVAHNDQDNDVTQVEIDWQDDGTFDTVKTRVPNPSQDWQGSATWADWTYPAAVTGGTVRVRVTDAAGHVATATQTVRIAPHRPLGALRRVTVDDRPVQAIDLSADGRYVLYARGFDFDDDPSSDPDPAIRQYYVLDREDGSREMASVLPDGTGASVQTEGEPALSPDGRLVAFGHHESVDGRFATQTYVRDLDTDTTTLASRTPAGQRFGAPTTVEAVTDDGRVLFSSVALGVDGPDPACLSQQPRCRALHERDTAAGTTTRVGVVEDSSSRGTAYSWNGRFLAWSDPDGHVFVRDGRGAGVPLDLPADWDGAVEAISDDGRVVTLRGETGGHEGVWTYAAGQLTVVSDAPDGAATTDAVHAASDASGGCTVFDTKSTHLAGDTGLARQLFLSADGPARRVSEEARDHRAGDADSSLLHGATVSGDGRWVLFRSAAGNLVPGDVNGAGWDSFLLHLDAGTCGTALPPPVNHAPELTLAGPASGTEGDTVPLSGTATDADGDPLTWSWTATGGEVTPGVAGSASVTLGDGPATSEVTATVGDGTTTVTRTWKVDVANAAPELALVAPASVPLGQPVRATASVRDPGGDVVTCTTSYADGPSTSGCGGAHTWAEPGRHVVTVVATDDDGASTTRTVTVDVTPDATPAPPVVTGPGAGHLDVRVRPRQRQHLGSEGRPKVRLVARVHSDQAVPLRARGKLLLRVDGRPLVLRLRPKTVQLGADRGQRMVLKLRRPAAVLVAGALDAWRHDRGKAVRAALVFRVTWADGTQVVERRAVRLR